MAVRNSLLEGFRQNPMLAKYDSPIFRHHEMLSLPRCVHFPAGTMATRKSALPSGTLWDFLLQDRHSLLLVGLFLTDQ